MKPVIRTSLVDTVVERLRALIADGSFGPGDRLPTESALIEQLQVSRTVLREAVTRLEAMGLVSVRGPRGMFVGDPGSLRNCIQLVRSAMAISPRELIQFTEFRRAIECDAVRAAARNATPADILELERLNTEIGRADLEHAAAYDLDLCFHRKLLSLANNEVMRNVMDVIQEFVVATIVRGGSRRRDPKLTQRDHRAITAAVKTHDPDAAEKAMRAHLDAVLQFIRETSRKEDREPTPSAG